MASSCWPGSPRGDSEVVPPIDELDVVGWREAVEHRSVVCQAPRSTTLLARLEAVCGRIPGCLLSEVGMAWRAV
jgi:hypothetical protein